MNKIEIKLEYLIYLLKRIEFWLSSKLIQYADDKPYAIEIPTTEIDEVYKVIVDTLDTIVPYRADKTMDPQ